MNKFSFQENDTIKALGPGLITGAADDDPSGIATYSQAGAQFGFNMLWTLFLIYPFMVGIQLVSARIGRVTGKGLAANIRHRYSVWLAYPLVLMLLLANVINIAADIAAMGEAMRLIVRAGSAHYYSLGFGVLCLGLQVFLPYQKYVSYLKWLTIGLLSYALALFTVHLDWSAAFKSLVWPHFSINHESIMMIVAIFGTTISPYLFFWQASQEVEEIRIDDSAQALRKSPNGGEKHIRRMKIDTFVGMGFSNLIAVCVMLTTAATLGAKGIVSIQTSAQAAEALRPLAGDFAFALFALGIIGTGLLAIPVLAGSAAYAVAETFHWRDGLNLKALQARKFYGIIALATFGGILLNFAPVDPIHALIWAALINGVAAVPVMIVMMLLACQHRVMGSFVLSRRHTLLGWGGVLLMLCATSVMLITL